MDWKILAIAIIAVALVAMFAIGSLLSDSGHSIRTTYNGTILEQPGSAIESAGQTVLSAFYTALGFIAVCGGFGVWLVTKYQL